MSLKSLIAFDAKNLWILDIGANRNMTGNHMLLYNYIPEVKTSVHIANGMTVSALGYGTMYVTDNLTLEHVLYVPDCSSNLISVSSK